MKESSIDNDLHDSTKTAYIILRDKILNREYKFGMKLNQGKISKDLGLSRTPVIKALHRLVVDGLVDNIHQKGFSVHRMSIQELSNAYVVLEALSGVLVEEIAESITEENIDYCRSIFKTFIKNSAWSNEKKAAYASADMRVHNYLWTLCPNSLAKNIHNTFLVFNRAAQGGLIREPADSINEHLSIIEALNKKDIPRAKEELVDHFRKTKEILRGMVKKLRQLGFDPEKISIDDVSKRM